MSYTPKEMKKVWARTQRYLNCEDPVRAQEMFDVLHSYVDGAPSKFTNQVRRAIGLPERQYKKNMPRW